MAQPTGSSSSHVFVTSTNVYQQVISHRGLWNSFLFFPVRFSLGWALRGILGAWKSMHALWLPSWLLWPRGMAAWCKFWRVLCGAALKWVHCLLNLSTLMSGKLDLPGALRKFVLRILGSWGKEFCWLLSECIQLHFPRGTFWIQGCLRTQKIN